jgi:hypothetical protein
MKTQKNKHEDLGLIAYNLPNSTLSTQYFDLLRHLIDDRQFNQNVIFNSYNENIDTLSVPILHVSQAKFFYGNLLVCDIPSLALAIECINYKNIYYYSTEIPWESNINHYSYWCKIFNTKNLYTIAANQRIYDT